MEAKLNVKGMTCNHCKMAVNNALTEMNGISKVDVDLDAGTVAVEFDEKAVSIDIIKEAIEEEGYTVA